MWPDHPLTPLTDRPGGHQGDPSLDGIELTTSHLCQQLVHSSMGRDINPPVSTWDYTRKTEKQVTICKLVWALIIWTVRIVVKNVTTKLNYHIEVNKHLVLFILWA